MTAPAAVGCNGRTLGGAGGTAAAPVAGGSGSMVADGGESGAWVVPADVAAAEAGMAAPANPWANAEQQPLALVPAPAPPAQADPADPADPLPVRPRERRVPVDVHDPTDIMHKLAPAWGDATTHTLYHRSFPNRTHTLRTALGGELLVCIVCGSWSRSNFSTRLAKVGRGSLITWRSFLM